MMFLKFWIVWSLTGLAIATWLFRWALRTGQFDDGRRAAQIPLAGVEPRSEPPAGSGRLDLAVLLGLTVVGILLTCAVVILALVKG